jgi:hypothetical protein
LTDKCRERR